MFIPPAERMHPARRGPHHKCGEVFGAGVVEQDVHAYQFVYLSHLHGEVQRLQVFQQLVSGSPVGECELAEGGHLREWSALRVLRS